MVITEDNKVILAKFVDPEQKERTVDDARSLVKTWMKDTGLNNIGMDIIMRIDAHEYFNK